MLKSHWHNFLSAVVFSVGKMNAMMVTFGNSKRRDYLLIVVVILRYARQLNGSLDMFTFSFIFEYAL